MKIRIEGCTAEELADYSPYLSLGKAYEVKRVGDTTLVRGVDDDDDDDDVGEKINMSLKCCAHLPQGAKWEEVVG